MPKTRAVDSPVPAALLKQVRSGRRARFRLLSLLYRETEGTPLRPLPIAHLQERAEMEPGLFRHAMNSLEAHRLATVFGAEDRWMRERWDQDFRARQEAEWEDREPGPKSYQVELTEEGQILFEYLLLHPEEETQMGRLSEVWDEGVFESIADS